MMQNLSKFWKKEGKAELSPKIAPAGHSSAALMAFS